MRNQENFSKCQNSEVLHQESLGKPRFSFLPAEDLILRRPDWLIEGILESGSFGMLYGSPSSGKSFSALDMGACVATGLDWHGNAVQQGGVLYFVGEGMQGVGRRKDAWTIAHEIEFKNSMFFATQFVDLKDRENSLPGFIKEIRKLSQKTKVKLLIIDTLSRYYEGDENVAGDMAHFISVLDDLRQEFEFAVLLVHHSGKDPSKGPRGSSVLHAALDTEMMVQKEKKMITITNTKQKDFELFTKRHFQLSQVELIDKDGESIVDRLGNPIVSCILEETEPSGEYKKPSQVGRNQLVADELFEESLNPGQNCVPLAELQKNFASKVDAKEPRKRWGELIKSEYFKNHYSIIGDDVYKVDLKVN